MSSLEMWLRSSEVTLAATRTLVYLSIPEVDLLVVSSTGGRAIGSPLDHHQHLDPFVNVLGNGSRIHLDIPSTSPSWEYKITRESSCGSIATQSGSRRGEMAARRPEQEQVGSPRTADTTRPSSSMMQHVVQRANTTSPRSQLQLHGAIRTNSKSN